MQATPPEGDHKRQCGAEIPDVINGETVRSDDAHDRLCVFEFVQQSAMFMLPEYQCHMTEQTSPPEHEKVVPTSRQ